MFHIDLTFEDCRIIANSADGKTYETAVSDNMSGNSKSVTLTALQLSMIFAVNMDNDGMPEGYEKYYEELEPIFKDWPVELRSIP